MEGAGVIQRDELPKAERPTTGEDLLRALIQQLQSALTTARIVLEAVESQKAAQVAHVPPPVEHLGMGQPEDD